MDIQFYFVFDTLFAFSKNIPRERQNDECIVLLKHCCDRLDIKYNGIKKDVYGKPFAIDDNYYFNFSHSADVVCCAINKTKRIGIDIQFPSEKLLKVKSRFLLPDEAEYCKDDINKLCKYWTIKEAVFKSVPKHFSSFLDIYVKKQDYAEDVNGYKYNLFCFSFGKFHVALSVVL